MLFPVQNLTAGVWLLLSGLLAVTLSGCSSAPPGTVEIRGAVTLDGKPVDDASVAFAGNNGARLATAQTDKEGKFTIQAALGKNLVTVSKNVGGIEVIPSTNPEDMLMPSDTEYKKMQAPKAGIPQKYADPKTSGLSIEVADGMPEVELALSSK